MQDMKQKWSAYKTLIDLNQVSKPVEAQNTFYRDAQLKDTTEKVLFLHNEGADFFPLLSDQSVKVSVLTFSRAAAAAVKAHTKKMSDLIICETDSQKNPGTRILQVQLGMTNVTPVELKDFNIFD